MSALDLDAVRAARAGTTVGARLEHRARCPSTQDEARALAVAGAPHGTVVIADVQTAGRGRQGRGWATLDGALAFSIVLRPALPLAKLPRLTLLAAVGLVDACDALGVDAAVKWPNDVFLPAVQPGPLGRWRKAAGLLVDVATKGSALDYALLGVGVNVGRPDDVPAPLADVVGCLADAAPDVSPTRALTACLAGLEARLAAPGDDAAFAAALAVLRARSATLGARVDAPGEQLAGRAVDFDDDGALVLEDDAGARHRVLAGDVWPEGASGYPVGT